MNSDLDKVLAYRNFLAAEDHLDEIMSNPESSEERAFCTMLKGSIINLRDRIMPAEKNPQFHCVVKHLATAYEACREVAKQDDSAEADENSRLAYELLVYALEKLWDREVITCERCKKDGRIQTEDGSSSTSTIDGGLARDFIQGIGDDRESSLPDGETAS